jgi:putative membrane protein
MKHYFILFIKGMAMGIANVIPGVSGGTIALITEIYEELINSLKSFDLKSLRLLLSLDIKKFINHTNLYFLLAVFGGSIVSVFSIAYFFKLLFEQYPIHVWGFFFGLILASVYFIGLRISKWNSKIISTFIIGTLIALSLSLFIPATQNSNYWFILICGIIGISGMILPGLSGSFILILLGNYHLLMIETINGVRQFKSDSIILLSLFIIGSIIGLISFSHVISWMYKNYKDYILSFLTGFILGSLILIWPFSTRYLHEIPEKATIGYLYIPSLENSTLITIGIIILGFSCVWILEKLSDKKL